MLNEKDRWQCVARWVAWLVDGAPESDAAMVASSIGMDAAEFLAAARSIVHRGSESYGDDLVAVSSSSLSGIIGLLREGWSGEALSPVDVTDMRQTIADRIEAAIR